MKYSGATLSKTVCIVACAVVVACVFCYVLPGLSCPKPAGGKAPTRRVANKKQTPSQNDATATDLQTLFPVLEPSACVKRRGEAPENHLHDTLPADTSTDLSADVPYWKDRAFLSLCDRIKMSGGSGGTEGLKDRRKLIMTALEAERCPHRRMLLISLDMIYDDRFMFDETWDYALEHGPTNPDTLTFAIGRLFAQCHQQASGDTDRQFYQTSVVPFLLNLAAHNQDARIRIAALDQLAAVQPRPTDVECVVGRLCEHDLNEKVRLRALDIAGYGPSRDKLDLFARLVRTETNSDILLRIVKFLCEEYSRANLVMLNPGDAEALGTQALMMLEDLRFNQSEAVRKAAKEALENPLESQEEQ